MKRQSYPFSAIIGQEPMKLCLILAAIDWHLSVLLRGEKGSGKSTAARALARIMPGDAPFVNVPIGITDDRLLGSLDLKAALAGNHCFQRGLIDEAHGGVLYLDEVNLLASHLADSLLDVSATGQYVVERDGFSSSRECHFVLLGSMNLEEGQLRPQLLDRFALALDVTPPTDCQQRAQILMQRLGFDQNPDAVETEFSQADADLRDRIAEARGRLAGIQTPPEMLSLIASKITGTGILSLRADLALIRASRALAAFENATEVTLRHIEATLPFVRLHRANRMTPPSTPVVPPLETPRSVPPSPPDASAQDGRATVSRAQERVFTPQPVVAPELLMTLPSASERGRTHTTANGNARPAPRSGQFAGLDLVRSLTEGVRQTGQACLHEDALIPRTVRLASGVRYLFVVDASGSQAARGRMRAVKGAAIAVLESASSAQDEAAIVAFRGTAAQVLLPPCRCVVEARQQLELLPTGGRTPLAHGLACARELTTPSTILVLITDGQANVPFTTDDPGGMRSMKPRRSPVLPSWWTMPWTIASTPR